MCVTSSFPANVMKWEKAVTDDEKELDKVRNDESRNMEVCLLSLSFTRFILFKQFFLK